MNADSFEEVERKVRRYNQQHLLDYYNNLPEGDLKDKFKEQLEKIDFELIDSLYKTTTLKKKEENVKIEPINYWDKERLGGKYDFYEMIGKEAIKDGKLAAVTMAGGQGTRLGHNGPKGTYDIGLDSHKSLFELLCDSLKEAGKKYGATIPWFIMTSEENNAETIEFFKKNKFFGYEKNIYFFIQGQLPMVDTEGKILIGENGLIKEDKMTTRLEKRENNQNDLMKTISYHRIPFNSRMQGRCTGDLKKLLRLIRIQFKPEC